METYQELTEPPLAAASTVEEIESYDHWPSPDWYDYRRIEAQCAQVREQGRVVVFMGDRLNRIAQLKPAMYLRGIEQILVDMMAQPELFRAIVDRIAGFYFEYLRRILEAARGGIDILVTGDDFGAQESLLCKPSLWRQMLQPNFRTFIDISHCYRVPVMHHTCGSVWEILPDLVDSGLDILNPIQPGTRNMEPDRLKRQFGDKLTFHGGISIQRNLPFGTPAAVRDEVRTLMAAMKSGGGFWVCTAHNIQADVPPENAIALFEAYQEYGKYER